ncbi:MAG: DNA polymerase subunit beta [Methanomicrobiales archaeon]|nr:DNA polymerase subunit beta [Methanomicrobiales archaeon]
MLPLRLRDFIEDEDGWLYAVAAYDNTDRVGCILRYIPDPGGERVDRSGTRYQKLDFGPAFQLIKEKKPQYLDIIHRVPPTDVKRVFKPEIELAAIASRDSRVRKLMKIFSVPASLMGCTGSLLCGLEIESSDIDFIVYGREWLVARERLISAVKSGHLEPMSEELWKTVYRKRKPDISFDDFILHEKRKWNRGQIEGTYFDLLYSRGYEEIRSETSVKGEVLGPMTIEALITDATFAYDNPAVYSVFHEKISQVLSFTHTYSGQAIRGEMIQARGICERHGDEYWLIVGTTREAKGEYIRSITLLEQER